MHKKNQDIESGTTKKKSSLRTILKSLLLYLDNIIAIVPGIFTHLMQLNEVFLRLRDTGLKLKFAKACAPVRFFRHLVNKEWSLIQIRWRQTASSIKPFEVFLRTVSDITISMYLSFLPWLNFCTTWPSRKTFGTEGRKGQLAFEAVRQWLVTGHIIFYLCSQCLYIWNTDTSGLSIRAVLSQVKRPGACRCLVRHRHFQIGTIVSLSENYIDHGI